MTVRVTRVHPDVGVDICAAPPAAGGVRKDDDEDRNNVGTRGMGYAKTADQDVVIARRTIDYARTTSQIDTTIKKLVRDGERRGEEDDGHKEGWGERHNNARIHPDFGVNIRAAPH